MSTIDSAISQLESKNLSYDMLYLGGNLKQDKTKNFRIDSNLAVLTFCKTTHAFAISNSIYDKFLNAYESIDWNQYRNWHHSNPNRYNIDVWYINNRQCLGNTYGVYPCIAEQR